MVSSVVNEKKRRKDELMKKKTPRPKPLKRAAMRPTRRLWERNVSDVLPAGE
jgi:hypothetical protein